MTSPPYLDDPRELDHYSSLVKRWISDVLEDEEHSSCSLQEYLADGSVLCRLANKKKEGSVGRYHNKATAKAMQLENIGKPKADACVVLRG